MLSTATDFLEKGGIETNYVVVKLYGVSSSLLYHIDCLTHTAACVILRSFQEDNKYDLNA